MTRAAAPGKQRRFDLIVLGAGPAGSAAARVAAGSGLRVALIDKARFPREKLCGGGLTGRAIGHYARIFDQTMLDVPLETRTSISFHAFGADLGTDRGIPPVRLGMRRSLDAALMAQAVSAGATDYTGVAGALDLTRPRVDLPDGPVSAPLVIAADGVNSPTARLLFGEAFDRQEIGFALEVEKPGAEPERPLRIDFGAAEWGYGWQFPKRSGTTIGVGGVLRRNPNMKRALACYLDALDVEDTLPVKGQFLPFGAFRAIPGRGRILLAGDAAGLVDPITGEGIGHALRSGECAAMACVKALKAGRPEAALGLYTQAIRPIHTSLRQARLLRNIIVRPSLRPAFIRSFRNSRTLRSAYLRLLAGETEYGDILRLTARRLPGFFVRSLRGV